MRSHHGGGVVLIKVLCLMKQSMRNSVGCECTKKYFFPFGTNFSTKRGIFKKSERFEIQNKIGE